MLSKNHKMIRRKRKTVSSKSLAEMGTTGGGAGAGAAAGAGEPPMGLPPGGGAPETRNGGREGRRRG